jgi:hypothetical protein
VWNHKGRCCGSLHISSWLQLHVQRSSTMTAAINGNCTLLISARTNGVNRRSTSVTKDVWVC